MEALSERTRTQAATWRPRRVLATRSARAFAHGRAILERAAARGIEIVELPGDRLNLAFPDDPRRAYAEAKSTLAVVVAPPSKRRLQPIAPSADWRVDLAEGCPAHCSYCYLAGSLKGPPITRVYANLDEILGVTPDYLGQGTITSRNAARSSEGTTFEASCYTDPLALEALTGSLSAAIAWFGRWNAEAQLRFTSKFADVEPLLGLRHNGRTRMRASVNPRAYARFEGGTAPVAQRLQALRKMAIAGYPIGLTIAPIIAAEGWQDAYGALLDDAGSALSGLAELDLTVELITHRYNAGSKAVLDSWYPGSSLDMTETNRVTKRTKFGTEKQVYDTATMRALRTFLEDRIAQTLPTARILYWT
ncbi:spore photoproduct lyase [Novosphingobium chloroacetimidivorans]|uniref:Spore photoproduct lyase n=1 Tax=Novosphingobium chloroacetimidivorans TaxID=1428314 RepID=A0A7W7KE57_9SPHN|nr:radical SAM protein [Novosphingobium chloroacetimidivorans]MBB4860418.1 spore photoproduct lyase [Novosphingobium chloroacetimidivorans]